MNIDAYNLDSLRALVRKLEKENQNLKQKLNEANIPYSSENIFDESLQENAEYDLDQGGRIMERYITENMAKWYFSMLQLYRELVWHGGMNLLGKVDAWDNLIRIKSESVAQELMGMIQEEKSGIIVPEVLK